MKKKAFIWGILISIIYFPWSVYAAPSIATTSGTFSGGSSVVISGSSFGATGPTIYKWDDFEGSTHTDGQGTGAGPGDIPWTIRTGTHILASTIENDDNRSGSTQYNHLGWTNQASPDLYNGDLAFGYDGGNIDTVYLTYYARWHANGGGVPGCANWKFKLMIRGLPTTKPNINLTFHNGGSAIVRGGVYTVSQGLYSNSKTIPVEGDWVRYELFAIECSAGNTADGTVILVYQQTEDGSFDYIINQVGNAETRDSSDNHWKYTYFSEYVGECADLTDFDMDLDDVYISSSRARVEIGNSPTFANCTHREIQEPIAWSDNSITITLNQGSFADCETVYLYVVDADGNVNTAGYPIRIVTGAGEPPCPPIGLKIK